MSLRALLCGLVALALASCGQSAPQGSRPLQLAAPEPEEDAELEEEELGESAFAPDGATAGLSSTSEKVRLELYIMSKCPFANRVIQSLVPVLDDLGDNIDLEVAFIGREKDGEFFSLHGEAEVQGDILYLCAADLGTQPQWGGFAACLSEDWRKIPENWERCAEVADLDAARMTRCYEGQRGRDLYLETIEKSKQRNATGSPTMFLAGEPYKGGRSEVSFARAICAAFEGAPPAHCSTIPQPVSVPVTVISDKRCKGKDCDPTRFISFVEHNFEGAVVRELDYSDAEGKEWFERSGEVHLPVAVFGPDVEKEESGFDRIRRRLRKIDGSNNYVYPLGRNWDPTAEVCDDGVDNTGNGKVDCDDRTCASKKICREEIPRKLTLFVMSQCPYCTELLAEMPAVLKRFGKNRKRIDFGMEFIGTNDGGRLSSMRGQSEVAEDMRMICAQKHYPKRHKFMEYVTCRAAAISNKSGKEEWNDWKKCARKGIKAAVIDECADSREGRKLLEASFGRAADLDITASPTWLLNNKHEMQGRAAEAIIEAFCDKNPEVKGCR